MKKLKLSLTLLVLMIASFSFAEKVKLVSGNVSALKGKTILVKFVYDGTTVGKFKNEDDYIAKKRAEYNEKEPGKGDKWAKSWKADREERYEPKLLELINKYSEGTNMKFIRSGDADYTMTIKTTSTEPGYNILISRSPAKVDATITVTDKSGKEVARMMIEDAKGASYGFGDLDTGTRLSESYAVIGKALGKFLSK
jgi:hypothetical protein